MQIINSIFALFLALLFGFFVFHLSIVPLKAPWSPVRASAIHSLTEEQRAEMLLILSRYAGRSIEITHDAADEDTKDLARQFSSLFANAGWHVKLSESSETSAAPMSLGISEQDVQPKPGSGAAVQENELPEMHRALKALLIQVRPSEVFVSKDLAAGNVQLRIGRSDTITTSR